MKNVLVTGGAGFIGSHVAEFLNGKGCNVRILDNFAGGKHNLPFLDEKIEVLEGDCVNRDDCKRALEGIDTVFHLAAHAAEGQSVFIPIFNARNNIVGSVTLLVETINAGIKDFVFTSSFAAYGNPKQVPVKETSPLEPEDPYAATKKIFEDYLNVYHKLDEINPYIVRFFNVYGPRQSMVDPYRGVVPIFINKCLKGEPPLIFGDGLQERAFTYISDVVEPMCSMVGKKQLINNPINIGTEEVHSVKDLAEMISRKMGFEKGPEYVANRTLDVKVTYCDTSKAKRLMDYEAKVSLEDGIDKTIEWGKIVGPELFKYMDYVEIPKLAHETYKNKKI